MARLFRTIGGLIRGVFVVALTAGALLVVLSYLDTSGIAERKVRGVLADTVQPEVAQVVQETGGGLAEQAADALRGLLSLADEAWGQGALAAPASNPPGASLPTERADSRAVLELINQYRGREDLRAWRWDDRLAAFAQNRANDMIARNYFSHNDPVTGQIKLAELPTLVAVGENLFQVSGPAVRFLRNVNREVLTGWQNSRSHNELLLTPRMSRAGIAFARADARIVVVLIAAE